jgi:uncharacterized protein (DUF4415 family)
MENQTMKPEYNLGEMKSQPNPFAKQLKQQVTLPLEIEIIEYFEAIAEKTGISWQELINLYLQDCITSKRELYFD